MMNWQRGVVTGAFLLAVAILSQYRALAQEAPPGKADELRSQLEKLQSQLRVLERNDEQRGKVTEIGSSRGRVRDDDEPRLVVKVYDLSDLFTVAPSYPAYEPTELIRGNEPQPVFPHIGGGVSASGGFGGGGSFGGGGGGGSFGGGGGGLFAVPNVAPKGPGTIERERSATLNQASGASGAPASNVRTSMESLIQTITSTIDPEGWADVGGPSTIAPVGSSLLISTTSETHGKLTALIDLFRQRWGSLRTISVQAHWLWLTPARVDEVLVQPKPGEAVAASQISLNTIAPKVWQEMLAAAAKDGAPAGYHAIVTCYNGQTVATQAGTQRIVVTGIQPVVGGGESSAAYSPVLRAVHEGATLQITPLATRHVKYVVLDVHSRVSLLPPSAKLLEKVEKVEQQVKNDPRQVVAALDRTVLQTQRLETTLRLPVGQPTLIGGMTFASAEGKNSHLYLFITAKVQELRDDEPTAAPATPVIPKVEPADQKPLIEKK